MTLKEYFARFGRRKELKNPDEVLETKLKRCLSTLDITLMGIGHMMGSGIYVISPTVAKKAGPACIISYLIAGIASMLAALSYAEFGVRFPRAGSAYTYVYFSIGEFMAFIVGWNVILENALATSAVVQSCSSYINSLSNEAITDFIGNNIGNLTNDPKDSFFNAQPDLLALVLMIIFAIILMLGTVGTSWVGNILCVMNICMLLILIGIGIWKADIRNWTNPDTGGFLPNGVEGVFSAASMCFFAYGGFDAISAAGEEAKNPRKSMPIATVIAMFTVTILYTSVSACLTLMRSWTELELNTGFPDALEYVGVYWAKYMITVGALCGMTTVAVVTLYTIVRAAYSMSEDGLLGKLFSNISKRVQVPQYSMIIFAVVSSIIAMFLNIETIVDMLSIGTLMAYMMVTCGMVTYRYSGSESCLKLTLRPSLQKILDRRGHPGYPITQRTFIYINLGIIISCTLSLSFYVQSGWHVPGSYPIPIILGTLLLTPFVLLNFLQQVPEPDYKNYKMPFMPVLPMLSIIIDALLMSTLPGITWIRLVVWLAIGTSIYMLYGVKHSKLENDGENRSLCHSVN